MAFRKGQTPSPPCSPCSGLGASWRHSWDPNAPPSQRLLCLLQALQQHSGSDRFTSRVSQEDAPIAMSVPICFPETWRNTCSTRQLHVVPTKHMQRTPNTCIPCHYLPLSHCNSVRPCLATEKTLPESFKPENRSSGPVLSYSPDEVTTSNLPAFPKHLPDCPPIPARNSSITEPAQTEVTCLHSHSVTLYTTASLHRYVSQS